MNTKLIAATFAAASLLATAGASHAAIVVDHTVANQLYALDSGVMLKDFDAISNPNVSYAGNVVLTAENPVSTSAAPPYTGAGSISICCQGGNYDADPTHYASVQGGQTSTFSVLSGFLTGFSFYMGSPDTYNHMTFNLVGGGSQTLDGDAIWGGTPAGNGDRTKGFRVYYNFNGAKVSSINFSSGTNAFEFDGLAGTAVPEPASWALMIAGFGFAGGMVRAKRRAAATA